MQRRLLVRRGLNERDGRRRGRLVHPGVLLSRRLRVRQRRFRCWIVHDVSKDVRVRRWSVLP